MNVSLTVKIPVPESGALNVQLRAAILEISRSSSGPSITSASDTLPFALTSTSTGTVPEIFFATAMGGYGGLGAVTTTGNALNVLLQQLRVIDIIFISA